MTVLDHTAHYALRDALLDSLRADLLGPVGGEHEVLVDDVPVTVYPVGVLFPRSEDDETRAELADADVELDGPDNVPVTARQDSEEQPQDLGVAMANTRRPSSMGLTFAVDPAVSKDIVLTVRAATYTPEDADGNPIKARRTEVRSTEEQRERWRRVALNPEPVTVDVTVPGAVEHVLHPGLTLQVLVRVPAGPRGTVTMTATVVNSLKVGRFDLRDAHCFYQPVLEATAPDGRLAPFVERQAALGAVDEEQALGRLLHRHAPGFATGHGCAAHWEWTPPPVGGIGPERAAVAAVRTELIPSHEVLLTDSNRLIEDSALRMHDLGMAPTDDIVAALGDLLIGYEEWIAAQAAQAESLRGTEHETPAEAQLVRCGQALKRMRRGVDLLADPERPEIMAAFRLANLAMAEQRARTSWIKGGKPGRPEIEKGTWRPFQISFLLLCLEGIVDSDHDDRGVADLLWFPTGGGKTEAYLGLIAFTTFLRRIRHRSTGGGVTVLMRYTLRLLTLQQFERAAALICAMELRRAADPSTLGTEPISIGMWVGRSATPNTLADAARKLTELRNNPAKRLQSENPVQLQACPWCGTPLDAGDYEVDDEHSRMEIRCPDRSCDFRSGLPVHLVDEAIYHARPTLIIATVDKFASMPWRPATAALFNRDREDGVGTPELIVQDELHLISGPLGTLTGLYETAVDALAGRPKIIASTATIRRADDQGRRLFNRDVRQFPPGGLDSRDSWFAVETPRDLKAARRYVGLFTSATSQSTLLIRVYAALLHRVATSGESDEVKDAYWTLVGYFNSLRLLSAAELQVLDDVQDRLEYLAERETGAKQRRVDCWTELSSRANAGDIPKRLKEVERRLPMKGVLDVLLATNMISVGVDVDRLGLMAVMGQPQTTAEYIQATSRVGRLRPGLVAVMLNSTRSRDRSHYEGFRFFHSALYREVESTSVTPFSARARDRGLHAVIVALARILLPQARANDAARCIDDFVDELNDTVRPVVLDRVRAVDEEEAGATERAFDAFVAWWRSEAQQRPNLVYEARRSSPVPALLSGFDDDTVNAGRHTLWSLRDVDASSTFFLES